MANKFKNLDAMFSEMKCETVDFELFGKKYKLKKRIPAAMVIELARRDEDEDVNTPKANMERIKYLDKNGRMIFGDEQYEDIVSNNDFTVAMLDKLLQWAFAAINGTDDTPEVEEVIEDDLLGDTPRKN